MNRWQRLAQLSGAELASLNALTQREQEALRALTDEQQEVARGLGAASARTVGDMTASEFFGGIGEAVGESLRGALSEVGAGRVDRSRLAAGTLESTGAGSGAGESREQADHDVVADFDVTEARENMGLSAYYAWERSPQMRACKSEAEREHLGRGLLLSQEWVRAMNDNDPRRARALALSTYPDHIARQMSSANSAGLIPQPVAGPIMEQRLLADKITPRCMQYRSESASVTVTAEGVVINAQQKAENADLSTGANDPTYPPIVLTKKKTTAYAVTPRELLDDASAAMDLVGNLSRQAGRAIGDSNNVQNMTGDGLGLNFSDGILTAAAAVVGASGAATRDIILNLLFAVPDVYRTGPLFWFADSATALAISLIEDTSGRPIYPNLNTAITTTAVQGDEGNPGQSAGVVEGVPLLMMPSTAMAGVLAIGNLDYFAALVEDSIRAETTKEGGGTFENDQQAWKWVQRQDGATGLADAFRKGDGALLNPV